MVFLSLVWACGFATAAIGDQADLLSARNIAATRAEQTADSYLTSCGEGQCNATLLAVHAGDRPGTVIEACLSASTVLVVDVTIPMEPRLFITLDEATASVAETLPEGTTTPALPVCTA